MRRKGKDAHLPRRFESMKEKRRSWPFRCQLQQPPPPPSKADRRPLGAADEAAVVVVVAAAAAWRLLM